MSAPRFILLTLPSLLAGVTSMSVTNGVQFVYPTQGVTLHYNDYVEVQYTSNFSEPWLYTFCEASDGNTGQKQSQGVGGGNNTATIKLDWSGSDTPCWFDLKPNSTAAIGQGANSDQWSFDVSQRAATTDGLGTTSTSAAASSSATTSASAGVASTASGSGSGSSSLSAGAYAGIGVAAAIAAICIGAGAVLLYLRSRRRQRDGENGASEAAEGLAGFDRETLHTREPKGVFRGSQVTEVDSHVPAAQEMYAGHESGLRELP